MSDHPLQDMISLHDDHISLATIDKDDRLTPRNAVGFIFEEKKKWKKMVDARGIYG